MKKLLLFIFVISGVVRGQQTEQLTQYVFNQFGLNPAFAGMKACMDTRLGFRAQWLGLEGAPRTGYANVNGRILQRRGFYKHTHGLGGSVLTDVTGPTGRTFVNLAYAIHLPLTQKLKASMGISAGLLQYRFNRNYITLTDPNDNAIANSQSKLLVPDINMGLLVYNEKFYAGLTLKQVWRNDLSSFFPDSRLTHHYYINVGKKFETGNEKIFFVPSVLFKYTRSSVPALDINVIMDLDQTLAVGLSFRNADALAAMFRFNFLKRFSLGYSFDLTTSKLRYGSSNTHEIVFGIYSCPIKESDGYECPTF